MTASEFFDIVVGSFIIMKSDYRYKVERDRFILFKLIKKIADPIWEIPFFYKLVQTVLAGGGHDLIKKYLKAEISLKYKKILDQGCGTGEYSLLFKDRYFGLDNNKDYIQGASKNYPGNFILGDATNMKLKQNSFDVVFSVGLHHHLNDELAKKAINQALRVTKKGGKVVIVDAMMPKNKFNIIGYFLRKIDRGGEVRRVSETLKLIPRSLKYKVGTLSSFPFDYITLVIVKI